MGPYFEEHYYDVRVNIVMGRYCEGQYCDGPLL